MRPAIRNFGYNLAGQLLPMAFALVSLPILARHAGTDRLGFLGLAWSLIGYFALLDLGLSRIVTRRVALADLHGALATEKRIVRRLCVQLFVVAAILSGLLAIVIQARWIMGESASSSLIAEANGALPVLFLTIPATVVTGLLRGALEGMQRFAKVNLLRSALGAMSFAAPLAVLPWRHDLQALTMSIAIVRVVSLFAHGWLALRSLDAHADGPHGASSVEATGMSPAAPRIKDMVREGGWLTVSNVVGPLMVTFDRFAVAGIVSLTAASYYFVPQEIALRLLVVPGAVATTIFPMMARLDHRSSDRHRISRDALLAIAAASLPACAILAACASPLLTFWMGATFADAATPVAAIIAVGLFGNCCAQAPFAWIQAAGRADVTGKLHLLQLPFYALLLAGLTWHFGVVGTATAWSLRALADFGLLFVASSRMFPTVALVPVLRLVVLGLVGISLLVVMVWFPRSWPRTLTGVALIFCLGLAAAMAVRLGKNLKR